MRSRLLACLAALAVLASACAVRGDADRPEDTLGDDAVTVGSFDFGESELLAELYAQALEGHGIRVVRQLNLGPRELVEPALERGLLELVPEYAGSLLEFLVAGSSASDLLATRAELSVALDRRGLLALESAEAQSQNGFAVTLQVAQELELRTLSDLASRPGLVLGGPPECPQRPLCQPGLEGTYGFDFAAFVPLDSGGPLTTDALVRGVVDLALIFTTSAEIVRHGFVLLEDDRHLQPAEHVTPVIHAEALERFGARLTNAVEAVSAQLTTDDLRAMNAEMAVDGRTAAAVARAWLTDHGLLGPAG
ncbi:MAG: ABC transporter substrate-binding protein [Actinomycetota bacterium]